MFHHHLEIRKIPEKFRGFLKPPSKLPSTSGPLSFQVEKAADWTLQRAAKNTLREALRYVTAEQEAGRGSGRVDGGWVFRGMMEEDGAPPNY